MRPFSVAAAESGVICSTVSSLFSANATDSQLVGLALVMAALELAGCAAAIRTRSVSYTHLTLPTKA